MQQTFLLLKKVIADKLTLNQKKFVVEVIGTLIVVVLATGAVVIDAKYGGILGIPFIAFRFMFPVYRFQAIHFLTD